MVYSAMKNAYMFTCLVYFTPVALRFETVFNIKFSVDMFKVLSGMNQDAK